jgi:hypothetical protein
VWFDAAAFSGDGAGCGIAPLPVATEWIFVAYRIEGRQELGTGLCSPHGALTGPDTDAGRAMLADAVRTFGPGFGLGAGTPGTPRPDATPGPDAPAGAASADPSPAVLLIGLVAALGFAAGIALVVARRRSESE